MPKTTNDHPSISGAEWQVMHEVWQSEPITSTQIIDRLAASIDWTPGTIKTLLHRLVQKGVISFQRKGNRYLYRSNMTEEECIDLASNQMLHTIFKGRPVPMLAYMVQSARLSGMEVETLQSMINAIKNELPVNAAS